VATVRLANEPGVSKSNQQFYQLKTASHHFVRIVTMAGPIATSSSRSGSGSARAMISSTRRTARTTTTRLTTNVRLPVLLEFTSCFCRVGYAGEALPHFGVLLHPDLIDYNHGCDTNGSTGGSMLGRATMERARLYQLLFPLVEECFGRIHHPDPTTRNVVVIFDTGLTCPQTWQETLEGVLHEKHVPHVTFQSCLSLIPTAFPNLPDSLTVHVTNTAAYCMAQAGSLTLPFTFQTVPAGYRQVMQANGGEPDLLEPLLWTEAMTTCWLDPSNPNSLVTAFLSCIQACPRQARPYVIGNVVFTGEAISFRPDLPNRVLRQVKTVLLQDDENRGSYEQQYQPGTPLKSTENPNENLSTAKIGNLVDDFTRLCQTWSELRPLAGRIVGYVDTAPYPADRVVWAGSSVWAQIWHGRDPDAKAFGWRKPIAAVPEMKTEYTTMVSTNASCTVLN
jgi:hypothetical protein